MGKQRLQGFAPPKEGEISSRMLEKIWQEEGEWCEDHELWYLDFCPECGEDDES